MAYNDYFYKSIQNTLNNIPKITLSQEFIDAMQMVQKNMDYIRKAIEPFENSGAVKALQTYVKQLQQVQVPKIPQETIDGIRRANFLNVLKKIQWPLYIRFDDELMDKLYIYSNETDEHIEEIKQIIYEFCDKEFIENLYDSWLKSSVIEKDRLPILRESITLYDQGKYYGAVSLLLCQLSGIINDTYAIQKSYNKNFSKQEVKPIYEHYNPGKSYEDNKKGIRESSEKTRLLWFLSDTSGGGLLYWMAAIEYLYNIVLTSEESMNQSEHPCRNKVCHGIQLNYGTKEHALKAILSVDLIIQHAERLKVEAVKKQSK